MKIKPLYLALSTALISGLAVFFNSFAVKVVNNSNVLTTTKNILVALILSLIILTPSIIKKIKQLTKRDWLNLIIIGFIGGSIPFLLFFKGLSLSSSVNAGFIHKTLFIWVTLLAIPLLKEKLSKIQWLALAVLLLGNYFLIGFKWSFSKADLLILGATILWAVEFIIAKKILRNLDAKIVAWGRMFFGSLFLIGYLTATNQAQTILTLNLEQWGLISFSSIFLLGYVLTWYHALAKLPATIVTSILVIASPITTTLNAVFVTHQLKTNQLIGSLVIACATAIFFYATSKIKQPRANRKTI